MLHQDLILPYLLRDSETQSAPILIILHGYGSNEQDLFSFVPELPPEFIVYSLRAPQSLPFGGYAWYEISFENTKKHMDMEQAERSLQSIIEFIQSVNKKEKHQNSPVWIMGFSQGAILGMALAVRRPDLISKVLALSGYFDKKLIGNVKRKEDHKNLAVFVSHGKSDTVIPFAIAAKAPSQLMELGINVQFKHYPNVGHAVSHQNFLDILGFIGLQRPLQND